ncbi:hypothetical protein AK88_01377 [Plasmodium fragile]|uniref:Uncharacterized protein n=1 Tax=Plasmodium fragile TaxID=5857 RepID=A0A0D9QPM5_PLAFR|nr:uncharacterized protein AK88_01377 [Plasmodium fragile]KJP88883.1 hypothetical protein AK88_01377 [Plasmodium fragile]
MVNNKNKYSRGCHGYSSGSVGSLNKDNSFLKVFVFTLVILAIQCYNESFSVSVHKSSGNGAKVCSRLLFGNFGDSIEHFSLANEKDSSDTNIGYKYILIVDENDNEINDFGSAGNLSLCSTIDGDMNESKSECMPALKEKIFQETIYGPSVVGESTVEDTEYEDNLMKEFRNKKYKEKLHKRAFRFLKKHHYIIPGAMSAIALLVQNTYVAVGVLIVYAVLLILHYLHKKLKYKSENKFI